MREPIPISAVYCAKPEATSKYPRQTAQGKTKTSSHDLLPEAATNKRTDVHNCFSALSGSSQLVLRLLATRAGRPSKPNSDVPQLTGVAAAAEQQNSRTAAAEWQQ